VLTIVALGATLLHGQLIRSDRLARMDQQIIEAAEKIYASSFSRSDPADFNKADKILSDELGDQRIGKLFVLRDADGKELFKGASAKLLPLKELPMNSEWVTLYSQGKLIRIYNHSIPNFPNRILQVGLIIDNSLISPAIFSPGNLLFVASIFLLGLISSWALTSTLLRPISQLVDFISNISPESSLAMPLLPDDLILLRGNTKKRDELQRLVDSFSSLMEKVNRGYKLSRVWSYQMAHELKTPLAIMEGEISNARKKGELSSDLAKALLKELMEASETVTAFLTWAELEGANSQTNLYAVSAKNTLANIRQRLNGNFGERLQINIQSDFYVVSNLQHFEHLLLNLITNALAYSPVDQNVEVLSPSSRFIRVIDRGPGISPQVLERLGEPFNRGSTLRSNQSKSHGLGLAYVHSVCRIHSWKLEINSTPQGTEITVIFPDLTEDSLEEPVKGSKQNQKHGVAHSRT
jgi:signal transduction histidine kinase